MYRSLLQISFCFSIILSLLYSQASYSQIDLTSITDSNHEKGYHISDQSFLKLDSLFIESNFEVFSIELKKMSLECDSCGISYLNFLDNWADTIALTTKNLINASSYTISLENIKILDDLNFHLIYQNLKWLTKEKEISELKCKFNTSLKKTFSQDILKAYNLYKTSSKLSLAGDLIANVQFYRLKFFRDICFDRNSYDLEIKKVTEISNWIEKATINANYQAIADNKPEWVKMGMSYEQYQEWWAQKLSVGSSYMGGGCNTCGKTLFKGKRGGTYYINSKGNKQYVPRK